MTRGSVISISLTLLSHPGPALQVLAGARGPSQWFLCKGIFCRTGLFCFQCCLLGRGMKNIPLGTNKLV